MKKRYVPTHLKNSNRRIVYDLITCCGTFSRTLLSQKSGISGPTILKIIDFFLDKGIVIEDDREKKHTQVGRTPMLLRFNPDFAHSLGVFLDGEYLACGILDMCGGVKYCTRLNASGAGIPELFDLMPGLVESCIRRSRVSRKSILGLGIGLPGVLDAETAILEFAPLAGVSQPTDLKIRLNNLEKILHLPILVENDVHAAAWGEFCMRRPAEIQDLIYLSLGAGLGAGVILNGQILRGRANMAGEIGYLCCDPDFIARRDEPGWLEKRINQAALKNRFGWDSRLGLTALSCEQQKEMIGQISACLSLAIANMNAIAGVEFFVLGGPILSLLGQPLSAAVAARLARLSISRIELVPPRNSESGLQGLGFLVGARQLSSLLQDSEPKRKTGPRPANK